VCRSTFIPQCRSTFILAHAAACKPAASVVPAAPSICHREKCLWATRMRVFEVLGIVDTRGIFQVDVTGVVPGLVGRSERPWCGVACGVGCCGPIGWGLTRALSVALTQPGFWPVHDRGRVLLGRRTSPTSVRSLKPNLRGLPALMSSLMSDGCSSPRGHNYQQNAKGEWRCIYCGQQM
jgi:hypothetical protein